MNQLVQERGRRLVASRKARFGLVGVVNTIVDFIVLNILAGGFGLSLFVANIGSTSAAMATSFALNKRAVFPGSDNSSRRQLTLFIILTLIGVWGVQGGTLALVHFLLQTTGLPEEITRNAAKAVGICAGLVWNYIMYSRVVFKGSPG